MARVQEIMTRPAVTCRPDDTLDKAAKLMWDHDCGIVAVASEGGPVVGTITDRDICMATYTRGKAPAQIPVGESMAKQVLSCHPVDKLERALWLMRQCQVRRLPVVDREDRPIGMLSLNNITRYVAAVGDPELEQQLLETTAAICEPRTAEESRRIPRLSQAPLHTAWPS